MLQAECDFTPVMPTFPFGAHLAVVEVDTETGHTRLTRLVALDDAGRILNPLLAEGQVHGGIAQGVAQALFEAVRYSDDGQPQTTNFADYLVISAPELPSFEVVHMETPTFANPLGAKGVGESGTIGAIPAVYNAVIDALVAPRHSPPRDAPHAGAHLERAQPNGLRTALGYAAADNQMGEVDVSTQASTKPSKGGSVSHLVLNVRDIEASHHFYTELLGFDQCAELTHTMTMRFYRGTEVSTTTTSRSSRWPIPTRRRPPEPWTMEPRRVGVNHIAIGYPDREAWLNQLAHLKANGVEFIVRGNHGMTHSAYIADPDGYGIEVLYDLPEEVWSGDVDATLNYFEYLPPDQALEDTTDYQKFGPNEPEPVGVPGRIVTRESH